MAETQRTFNPDSDVVSEGTFLIPTKCPEQYKPLENQVVTLLKREGAYAVVQVHMTGARHLVCLKDFTWYLPSDEMVTALTD